ncbi:MAG TPA: hypothetical protein PLT26_16840 [Anaerolineaceae bacterium]|nr:hypothetical protein [Anaerolineaceae bacterium]
MEEHPVPNYSALWLRVWHDPTAAANAEWLVQVFNFADGQTQYFDSPDNLLVFLRRWLAQTNQSAPSIKGVPHA